MSVRYIVRPNHILTTPKKLKEAFGAQATRAVNTIKRTTFDYTRDFFFACPNFVSNAPAGYPDLLNVYHLNKLQQRKTLEVEGFPIPVTLGCNSWYQDGATGPFVVRPLRHYGGQHYRIAQDHRDYNVATEYISAVYPKTHEYRIITVYGKPCLTLLKRVPEGLSNELPWNHANGSTFITVDNQHLDRLRHTDIYEKIATSELIQTAHILAIDVLLKAGRGQWDYVVCEINFSPSLSIQSNIVKVVEYALEARQ